MQRTHTSRQQWQLASRLLSMRPALNYTLIIFYHQHATDAQASVVMAAWRTHVDGFVIARGA